MISQYHYCQIGKFIDINSLLNYNSAANMLLFSNNLYRFATRFFFATAKPSTSSNKKPTKRAIQMMTAPLLSNVDPGFLHKTRQLNNKSLFKLLDMSGSFETFLDCCTYLKIKEEDEFINFEKIFIKTIRKELETGNQATLVINRERVHSLILLTNYFREKESKAIVEYLTIYMASLLPSENMSQFQQELILSFLSEIQAFTNFSLNFIQEQYFQDSRSEGGNKMDQFKVISYRIKTLLALKQAVSNGTVRDSSGLSELLENQFYSSYLNRYLDLLSCEEIFFNYIHEKEFQWLFEQMLKDEKALSRFEDILLQYITEQKMFLYPIKLLNSLINNLLKYSDMMNFKKVKVLAQNIKTYIKYFNPNDLTLNSFLLLKKQDVPVDDIIWLYEQNIQPSSKLEGVSKEKVHENLYQEYMLIKILSQKQSQYSSTIQNSIDNIIQILNLNDSPMIGILNYLMFSNKKQKKEEEEYFFKEVLPSFSESLSEEAKKQWKDVQNEIGLTFNKTLMLRKCSSMTLEKNVCYRMSFFIRIIKEISKNSKYRPQIKKIVSKMNCVPQIVKLFIKSIHYPEVFINTFSLYDSLFPNFIKYEKGTSNFITSILKNISTKYEEDFLRFSPDEENTQVNSYNYLELLFDEPFTEKHGFDKERMKYVWKRQYMKMKNKNGPLAREMKSLIKKTDQTKSIEVKAPYIEFPYMADICVKRKKNYYFYLLEGEERMSSLEESIGYFENRGEVMLITDKASFQLLRKFLKN